MAEEDKGEGNHANAERFEPGKKDVKLQSIDGLVKQKQTTRREICQRGIGDLERGYFERPQNDDVKNSCLMGKLTGRRGYNSKDEGKEEAKPLFYLNIFAKNCQVFSHSFF